MLELFKEFDDRYELELENNSNQVVVCVDKSEISDLTEQLLSYISDNLENIISNTLRYFEENKESHKVGYIDELSDPQIILGADEFSVYSFSEKGEDQGDAIIGIDYSWQKV
mgnify:CR=1 FL=1